MIIAGIPINIFTIALAAINTSKPFPLYEFL
jgi:hypothetical protein